MISRLNALKCLTGIIGLEASPSPSLSVLSLRWHKPLVHLVWRLLAAMGPREPPRRSPAAPSLGVRPRRRWAVRVRLLPRRTEPAALGHVAMIHCLWRHV